GKSVREVVLERGLLTEAELDDIFSVQNLMHPAYKAKRYTDESVKMGVLTEVSNDEERERAIALGAKVVGINNRDLRDLSIDLNRT
ncbi:hypothetical protein MJL33_31495, partial [Salmonella enterica subsp. enterica serovar Kentucky]|nr:hypothetical protein [Salmonella enterica subsp. enterica serovar Kentucky]